jgi:aspartate aminotransferase
MRLAERIGWMKPSPTLEINAKAQALRAQGVNVISLAAGEPDFATPEHIVEAAHRAVREGHTRYTPVPGDPALRRAVAKWHGETRGGTWEESQVIVGCGAKQILTHFFHAVLDPGDQVLLPVPCWVSYPTQIRMVGGEVVEVETRAEDGWVPRAEALEAKIGPRTRALVLNSPNNPTGAAFDRAGLEAIAAVLVRHPEIWVISDEIYRTITFDGFVQESLVTVAPSLAERVLVVDGVSKTYSMTGWRVGWGVGPAALVSAIARLAGQTTSCAPAPAQRAAIAALEGDQTFLEPWLRELQARRDLVVRSLVALDGIECASPRGTFYALADVRGVLGRHTARGDGIGDAVSLCKYLLDEAKVAAVPGEGFRAPGFVRLSFACATDVIRDGMSRIAEAVGALR